jgi:hypothetical protein
LHELGDVKKIAVELVPIGLVPVVGSVSPTPPEAVLGPSLKFIAAEGTELLEIDDTVVVVAHKLEGGQTAVVEAEVEFEHSEKFTCDGASVEGKIAG